MASVYKAMDTIHLTRVALKIPHAQRKDKSVLEDFQKEVRIAARLEHHNILPVQNASFIGNFFVIATPLGKGTLAQRLGRRASVQSLLDLAGQAVDAVAYAHSRKVIHCDLKPENFILFDDEQLKLADFGFARKVYRTMKVSGSGTLGYIAPEQAVGRLMFQSDVFSLGLILYRMFAGNLPEWPYKWPPRGIEKIRRRLHPRMIALIRKSIDLNPKNRFSNAMEMQVEFEKSLGLMQTWINSDQHNCLGHLHDEELVHKEFQRQFKSDLETHFHCRDCNGPVASNMSHCPWCGVRNPAPVPAKNFKHHCPRCNRGSKSEWNYCSHCYGPGFEVVSPREYGDKRYVSRCENKSCRKPLMRFMRYCPWCKTKVKRAWKIPGTASRCPNCKWGIASRFWQNCAWCGTQLKDRFS